ncbi:hypothetical protein [Lysobacter fragariae]
MPDSFDPRRADDAPAGWSQAFATMPLEAAPADGWARVSAALDRREAPNHRARRDRRTSWLIGAASAAVLAIVAWAPLQRMIVAPGEAVAVSPASGRATTAVVTTSVGTPTASGMTPSPSTTAPDEAATPVGDTQRGPVNTSRAAIASTSTGSDAPTTPDPLAQQRRANRDAARRATSRLVATLPMLAPPSLSSTPVAGAGAADTTDATAAIAALRAQSSQLEALVALARDERFGSATTVAITLALEGDIARIDTALAHPDLDAARRAHLWQQRVEALRQLAGVETTQRWFAAQGAHYDDAMVSVY